MTPPRLAITDDLPEGQALREDLVSTLDDQYSHQSYDQIENMVTNWQQDNNVTVRQTTTTTTTKEVVVPNRTPVAQQPPSLPRWTSEQLAASFAAFGRPTIQAAAIPPITKPHPQGRQLSSGVINDGFTTTERTAYERAMATTSTLPSHFDPPTPPAEEEPTPSSPMQVVDEPLPVPPPISFATKPSLFAPMRPKIQIPKSDPPVFPLTCFTEWMKDSTTRDELLGELVKNESPITDQFAAFSTQRTHANETKKLRTEVNEMKNDFEEFKKLGQRIELCLNALATKIAKAEDSQSSQSRYLLTKLPSQELMRGAPNFFMKRDDWTVLPKNPSTISTQPRVKEEFDQLPQQQQALFYNQHALKWALWNEEKRRFDSTYRPRPEYHDYSCRICHLFGHIIYDCPRYECPRCKNNCGHKPDNCKAPLRSADRTIMMADVPKAPLIARLKEKCTFLAKEPAPPQNDAHLEVTFIALKDSVEQYVATYTDQELQKELDKYIATRTPPNVPNEYYVPALRAEYNRRDKKRRDVLPPFPSFFERFREFQPTRDAFYDAGNIDPFYNLEF